MNKTEKVLVEAAQAMQQRFAAQTREQMKVSNRLSAQRDALAELGRELIEEIMQYSELPSGEEDVKEAELLAKLEAAKNLDPESG